jgi:hypothetical protein
MGDKVYKVVGRLYTGDLVSCTVYGAAEVCYKVGEFVQAPGWLAKHGYHLVVFDTFNNAKKFIGEWDNLEIWEADAEERVELVPQMALNVISGMIYGNTFLNIWPDGTRMYKRVKLLRRITNDDLKD